MHGNKCRHKINEVLQHRAGRTLNYADKQSLKLLCVPWQYNHRLIAVLSDCSFIFFQSYVCPTKPHLKFSNNSIIFSWIAGLLLWEPGIHLFRTLHLCNIYIIFKMYFELFFLFNFIANDLHNMTSNEKKSWHVIETVEILYNWHFPLMKLILYRALGYRWDYVVWVKTNEHFWSKNLQNPHKILKF